MFLVSVYPLKATLLSLVIDGGYFPLEGETGMISFILLHPILLYNPTHGICLHGSYHWQFNSILSPSLSL